MRFRFLTVALLAAFVGSMVIAPVSTSAQPNRGSAVTQMTATASTGEVLTGTVSNLVATFDRATGNVNISGVFTQAVTGATDTFTGTLQGAQQQGCQILFLDLGPLFLDLLGLQIDLSQIVLSITAVPGPGNLLGNLLCAVVGLFDGPASGNAIANLLNRLFGNLGL